MPRASHRAITSEMPAPSTPAIRNWSQYSSRKAPVAAARPTTPGSSADWNAKAICTTAPSRTIGTEANS